MMKREKSFSMESMERMANAFSEMVSRDYWKELLFLKCTLPYDYNEQLCKRVEESKREADSLKRNVYQRILTIMKNPEENKEFYENPFTISINKSNYLSFGNTICSDIVTTFLSVPPTTDYLINLKQETIEKRAFSSYENMKTCKTTM